MDYTQVKDMQSRFDNLVRRVPGNNIEFWYARDLQELLGYDSWIHFSIAMRRAISAYDLTDYGSTDHFRSVTREALLDGYVECDVEDFMLTRYACYLIAWNSNARRTTIVFAQSYFAIQTRKQKLVNDRMRLQALIDARAGLRESRELLTNSYERGEDDEGFVRLRLLGDSAMAEAQGSRKIQPENLDIKNLARRLKGELREMMRDFLT
jgi:DNA-damage-inducible protein D